MASRQRSHVRQHQFGPAIQLRQGEPFRGCRHLLMFRLLRSLGLWIAPTCVRLSSPRRPGRLHHAYPSWLPALGSGIATHPIRATDAAGLSPAGLRPCRLLRSPGSQTKSVRACQVLRPRRVARALAIAHSNVLPSATQTASAPRNSFLSRLNGWPVRTPTGASPTSSWMSAHGLGPM